jgi:hypothetical protein
MYETANIVLACFNNLYYLLLFKSRAKRIFKKIMKKIKPGWNAENLLILIKIKAFFSSYII